MMLVHKQPTFPTSPSPYSHHRRHPSAPPTVIVQPTRTPGLLSLSKPARPSPQRHHQQQQRQQRAAKPRSSVSTLDRSPLPAHPAPPPAHHPSAEITVPAASTPVPSEKSRGRQSTPKDKAVPPRSASHSSIRAASLRPSHPRQPSPPQSTQADGPQTPSPHKSASSNLFDPFLDDSPRPPPTLAPRPSGKLARRRQQPITGTTIPPFTPTPPSKAIPVPPQSTNVRATNFSRSDPVLSHMPSHRRSKRSSTTAPVPAATWGDAFPICDDMTDAGDLSDNDASHSPPVTPTRARPAPHRRQVSSASASFRYDKYSQNGPKTAPLAGPGNPGFMAMMSAMNVTPTPSPAPANRRAAPAPKAGNRKHRRTPSEGVFHMSSDEDVSSSSSNHELSANVQALFGLAKGGTTTPPPAPQYKSATGYGTVPRVRESRASIPAFSYGGAAPSLSSSFPGTGTSAFHTTMGGSTAGMSAAERERDAEERATATAIAAGYFASSMFQNSPSPEELPPPLFA